MVVCLIRNLSLFCYEDANCESFVYIYLADAFIQTMHHTKIAVAVATPFNQM